MATPLDTIKIKINAVCMNKCCFCMFNNKSDRISVEDLEKFFGMIKTENASRFRRVVINGGEPTLHPQFLDINNLMIKLFAGKQRLEIGTNLRLFEHLNDINQRKLNSIYDTYQRIQIGCDDEHHNIDIVEKLIPEFCQRDIRVSINSIDGYYSEGTKLRLIKLRDEYNVKLMFSPLAHDYDKKEDLHNQGLCQERRRDFLIDCEGKAYFCYQQELEKPIFNIHQVDAERMNDLLFDLVPNEKYRFCEYCERFVPEGREVI